MLWETVFNRSCRVPASAVPDNWCQKWDVQRGNYERRKTTLGTAEKCVKS